MEKGRKKEEYFGWWDLAKAIWFLIGLEKKRKQFAVLMSILFLILTYEAVPPLILGKIVNFFTGYHLGDSLRPFYFYSILLGSSMAIVSLIRLSCKKSLNLLRTGMIYDLKVRGFLIISSYSLIKLGKETTGERVQKMQNGIVALTDFFHNFISKVFSSIAGLVGIITIFLFTYPPYVLFFLAYILVFFIILNFFYKRLQKLVWQKNLASEKASGVYVEGLSNILTLKALGAEDSFRKHVSQKEQTSFDFQKKIIDNNIKQWKTYQVFNGISIGTFIFLVGNGVLSGALNIGEIVIFYSYLEKLTSFSDEFLAMYNNLMEMKAGIGRMIEIFYELENNDSGSAEFPTSWKEIKLEGANFSYKSKISRKKGIENLNLTIRRGEKIGVVGKTGSGKSTLAKILLRLYFLDKGKYFIGGREVHTIEKEKFFQHFSAVLQETELFNLSFRENVTLLREVSEETFLKALKVAQLENLVRELPMGLETLVGEKGYRLSGGEKQRLGIARALCQKGEILILDEATSSLDSKTEVLIQEALDREFPEKTIITIAHRVNTLAGTDRIIVFSQGRIVEEGTYASLLSNSQSKFSQIYKQKRTKNLTTKKVEN